MSEMTNLTTGAIGPDSSLQKLAHIKLLPLDERHAVCVFVTDTGHTETKNFQFDEDVSLKDIESCTDIINSKLRGVPIDELAERMNEIKPMFATLVQQHDVLFTAFVQAFIRFASENVYFSGKDKMLYQPEFEDIDKLKSLMNMLNDSTVWRSVHENENAVAIRTNKGAELTWFNDVAVVKSTFKVNDNESGQLMVVGPSRMNYDKIVSMIEYAAQMIEKMYRRKDGDDKNE